MDNGKMFETLNKVDFKEHVQKKNDLTYLSWAWAWAEVMKHYPDATYEIVKTESGLPYVASELGVMVYTRVTINGMTREMWLPVMDYQNRAMKLVPYEVKMKYGAEIVPAATMFDVNKTIMRCLVKNLAVFGLGLYIYAGEDLPEEAKKEALAQAAEQAKQAAEQAAEQDKKNIALWIEYCAQQNVDGLVDMYAQRANFAENQDVINAMFDQLHAIIKTTSTLKDLNAIYKKSEWAQQNQQVVDWCAERKAELQKTA